MSGVAVEVMVGVNMDVGVSVGDGKVVAVNVGVSVGKTVGVRAGAQEVRIEKQITLSNMEKVRCNFIGLLDGENHLKEMGRN